MWVLTWTGSFYPDPEVAPEEAAMVGVKQSHSLRKHIPTGQSKGTIMGQTLGLFQGSEKH